MNFLPHDVSITNLDRIHFYWRVFAPMHFLEHFHGVV